MIRKILFIIPFLMGCAAPLKAYRLQSGDVVECKWMEEGLCGVYLGDCIDKLERWCQVNVAEEKEAMLKEIHIQARPPAGEI